MIPLPTQLPAELAPLAWLHGVWEGSGVVDYAIDDEKVSLEFGQRISFSHDGLPCLNYNAYSWLLDESSTPLVTEMGYWRLRRDSLDADSGPGMLPGTGARPYPTAESVEPLRNDAGGFDVEVSLLHPSGVSEFYVGQVHNARVDLVTDAVMRSSSAKEYTAATRIYGLVEGHLLWAWDMAALGQDLRTHASGRLAKVD